MLGRNKKYTIEEVREIIEKLGYQLISDTWINANIKIVICDNVGYYYYVLFNSIRNGYNPKKFSKSNPFTIQNIKLWCKLNNKSFELISDIYEVNDKVLVWRCLNDDCGEIFKACWRDINNDQGCPFCVGRQVGLSNCLATLRPDLASEWHPTMNGDLTPYELTCGSHKEVWWQCPVNPKHEWKKSVNKRNNRNENCPYCNHTWTSPEYNLLIINPKLCEEWDYNKNKKKPEQYLPYSNKKVWWKCKECGNEWFAPISSRSVGNNCPQCHESKGEIKIREWLKYYKLNYISQKIFDGLLGLGNGNLSYDFYIPKYNLLIEYQGEQHEKYIEGFHVNKNAFRKQQEHDKRKRGYAKNNSIQLLEIWYWEFDNIETILEKELNLTN